jgi:hypothetical protein
MATFKTKGGCNVLASFVMNENLIMKEGDHDEK